MRKILTAALLLSVFAASSAWADNPKVNVHSFKPSVHPGDLLGVQTSAMTEAWQFLAGAYFSYTQLPLRIVNEDGDNLFENVSYQFMADVLLGINLFSFLDIGVDVPVLMVGSGQEPPAASGLEKVKSGALGDVRLGLKGMFLRPDPTGGFGLGLAEDIAFPTATGRNFVGDDGFSFTTQLVADYYARGWRVALNAGYLARTKKVAILPGEILPAGAESPKTYDEIVMGLGGQIPIICGMLEGMVTAESRTKATSPFSSQEVTALDLMAGMKFHYKSLAVTAAGGAGVMKAVGSPKMRFALGVAYEPSTGGGCCPDMDEDGVCDDLDRCPDVAGNPAHGGCADTDKDGVYDPDDQCPAEAGVVAFGGCPDTDGDGIEDRHDECRLLAGLPQHKGCPDTDGDGVLDHEDRCPQVAGARELEGCPDGDRDGVADSEDQCPTVAGVKENRGCPSSRIEITKEKIVLKDKVFFETAKAVILSQSFSLLDEMANTMIAHPEIARIRIEGHTDNKGKAKANLKLSQARAEAVRAYLLKAGVHPARMEAQGYGHKKPIASNKTEEGRATNRRVEFTILDRR